MEDSGNITRLGRDFIPSGCEDLILLSLEWLDIMELWDLAHGFDGIVGE